MNEVNEMDGMVEYVFIKLKNHLVYSDIGIIKDKICLPAIKKRWTKMAL